MIILFRKNLGISLYILCHYEFSTIFLKLCGVRKMGVFEKATSGNLNDVVYVYCNSSSFWFTYAYAI